MPTGVYVRSPEYRAKMSQIGQRNNWADLRSLYIEQDLTCTQIADIKGCSSHAVRYNLKRLGIPRRNLEETRNKISQTLKGRTLSEEHKAKISFAGRGRKLSEETRYKLSLSKLGERNPQYGKHQTVDTLLKKSLALKGHPVSNETKSKLSRALKGKQNCLGRQLSKETKDKIGVANKISLLNHYPSKEARAKNSVASKTRWQNPEYAASRQLEAKSRWENPEYIKHVLGGLAKRPTKAEKQLEDSLNKYFPGKYKYNGNFELGISLNHMIPDFVNVDGKKEVIETFGDYFHRGNVPWKRSELGRIMAYNSVGYHCLVIWASELKKLPEVDIVTKIKKWRRK